MFNPSQNPYPQQPGVNQNKPVQPNGKDKQPQHGMQNNYNQPNMGQQYPPQQYPGQSYPNQQHPGQQYPTQQNFQNPGYGGVNPNPYNQQAPYGNMNTQPKPQNFMNPQPNFSGQNPQPTGMNPPMYNPNPQTNMFMKNMIMQYADSLFAKYDYNKSGYLDTKEIYVPVCELFQCMGSQAPTYPQVLMIMEGFDRDKNGLLDINEFRTLLLMLNGILP